MSIAHPFDNVLRYHVGSRTRPQVKHLVDLELYGGNGACSCEHFTFKLEPYLKKGARSETGGLRCWHINRARERLADDVVRQAAKQLSGETVMRYTTDGSEPTEKSPACRPGRTYVLDKPVIVGGTAVRKCAKCKAEFLGSGKDDFCKKHRPPPRKKLAPSRTRRLNRSQ
jgi:hypothetical protein